jgi:hypothetical protein
MVNGHAVRAESIERNRDHRYQEHLAMLEPADTVCLLCVLRIAAVVPMLDRRTWI